MTKTLTVTNVTVRVRERAGRTRVYVDTPNGFDDDSRNRESMRAVRDALRTKEFLAGAKLSFSSKAGCSCGCSPGFVVREGADDLRGYNVWVDLGWAQ